MLQSVDSMSDPKLPCAVKISPDNAVAVYGESSRWRNYDQSFGPLLPRVMEDLEHSNLRVLSVHCYGQADAKALLKGLIKTGNTTLQTLCLCSRGSEGYFSSLDVGCGEEPKMMLSQNTPVTSLHLDLRLLQSKCTIVVAGDMQPLCEALIQNPYLKYLRLRVTEIGSLGFGYTHEPCERQGQALALNTCLETLYLKKVGIGLQGAIDLFKGLPLNQHLKTLAYLSHYDPVTMMGASVDSAHCIPDLDYNHPLWRPLGKIKRGVAICRHGRVPEVCIDCGGDACCGHANLRWICTGKECQYSEGYFASQGQECCSLLQCMHGCLRFVCKDCTAIDHTALLHEQIGSSCLLTFQLTKCIAWI